MEAMGKRVPLTRALASRRLFVATLAALIATGLAIALLAVRTPEAGAQSATIRSAGAPGEPVTATIARDSHGIPHITADNFGGIGFGYGYAFAQDNICTIAETYVTVRAERSRYTGNGVEGTFGPDGSYPQRGNGFGANNLNSDFFYQRIIDKGIIENLLDDPAPAGPEPEIREGVRGYVAGYNKYLEETGVDNLPDPRCRGAAWVKPISEMDAYRRFYQLALLASQSVAIDGIAGEKTPGGAVVASRPRRSRRPARRGPPARRDRLQRLRPRLGGDDNGKGDRARQPPLPLGRAGALLPDPPHHPR